MNDFTPTKLKDLSASKKRVMHHVEDAIKANSHTGKIKWQYLFMATILTICMTAFVLNAIWKENIPHTTNEQPNIQPTVAQEEGSLYVQGITLGDPQSKVVEVFGENYTKEYEDGNEADFIMAYEDARFYIYKNKVNLVLFKNVDKIYYEKIFNDYNGFKFTSTDDNDRFIYSNETFQIIKATTQTPKEELYIYLTYHGPELLENPDFLKAREKFEVEDGGS